MAEPEPPRPHQRQQQQQKQQQQLQESQQLLKSAAHQQRTPEVITIESPDSSLEVIYVGYYRLESAKVARQLF